jgi:hypothetical protein
VDTDTTGTGEETSELAHEAAPRVRRAKKGGYLKLPKARLDLADVAAIQQAFRTCCARDLSATAEGYDFDDAADLKTVGVDAVESVKFEGNDPYVMLTMAPANDKADLWLSDVDDPKCRVLQETVERILSAAKARTPPAATPERPTMRRVSPGTQKELPSAELFIDDIEEIEAAFRAACERGVTITAADYEFDHAEHLSGLNVASIPSLKIDGQNPYVRFELHKYGSSIWLSNLDDIRVVGLGSRVEAILDNARERNRRATPRVLLRRSTEPGPPGLFERNSQITAAVIGAVAGAIATGLVTLLLILTGVLKPGSPPP